MFFFFFFNQEQRLGYKKLTPSDLGLSGSHQTHIGLYEGVFTFLKDSDVVKSAILIYNNYCEVLDCTFDRIQTPDDTFRSPKIRIGKDPHNSVVSKIREFAKSNPDADWYLIWSGLESEELTFWLIRGESQDYKTISKILPKVNKVYGENDPCYKLALNILTKKVNEVSLGVQKEIETASQIGNVGNKFKRSDVDKAEKLFKEIGKKGEELVAEYLERQKAKGIISSYVWVNQSSESGLPYDFQIDEKQYVDVKSTNYDFKQNIYFSDQEINFASHINENYSVYRIYGMKDNDAFMKVCTNCNPYLTTMDMNITNFIKKISEQQARLHNLKLAILPEKCFGTIQPPIKLA